MLAKLFKIVYCLNALLLSLLIVYGKCFVFHKKEAIFVSDYTSSIAITMFVYIVLSIIGVFLYNPYIMGACAISPFIIGLITTYHTEKYFTPVQLIVFIASMLYIVIK